MVSKLFGYFQRISNFRPKTKLFDHYWMILYVLNRFKIVSGWSQMFWMVIKRYQYFQMSLNTPDISKWFQMFQFQNYQEIFRWFQVSRIFRDFFQSFLSKNFYQPIFCSALQIICFSMFIWHPETNHSISKGNLLL